MKWPRRPHGEEAKKAITDAQRQHTDAHATVADVEAVALAARMLKRRADRFVAEIERSLRGSG